MNRRGFLGSILAACAAPAIVRAGSLMRIVPMDSGILAVQVGEAMDQFIVTEITDTSIHVISMNVIAREAVRIARAKAKFLRLDQLKDTTPIVGDVLCFEDPERRKPGDTIRIRAPERYLPRTS